MSVKPCARDIWERGKENFWLDCPLERFVPFGSTRIYAVAEVDCDGRVVNDRDSRDRYFGQGLPKWQEVRLAILAPLLQSQANH